MTRLLADCASAKIPARRPVPGSSDASVFRSGARPAVQERAGQSTIEIVRLPPHEHLSERVCYGSWAKRTQYRVHTLTLAIRLCLQMVRFEILRLRERLL